MGSGIPVGEMALLSSLAIINYSKVLPRLATTVFLAPFALWWTYGIGRAILATPEYGLWALRDATHVIESLFLIVGFVFAASPRAMEQLFRWLPRILLIVCLYALTYPFASALVEISPKLTAVGGYETPLFFNYHTTSGLLLMAAAYLVLFRRKTSLGNILAVLSAAFLVGYSVFVFQQRTVYLQVIVIAVVLVWYRKDVIVKGYYAVLILIAAVMLISFVGLQIEGRMGQVGSVEFLVNHLGASVGIESEGVEGAAGGADLRVEWWKDLYEQWTASLGNFLFGLGYGFPLVEYSIPEAVVREPHNSYISILARLGLLGGIAFVWMYAVLLRFWGRTYRMCAQMNWREWQHRLLILLVFFVLVMVRGVGEPGFEKPFYAIPYYFFWGVVLQMGYQVRNTYAWVVDGADARGLSRNSGSARPPAKRASVQEGEHEIQPVPR